MELQFSGELWCKVVVRRHEKLELGGTVTVQLTIAVWAQR
jgi:hypothetical protein